MLLAWRFLREEDGTTAVEYAVILALILMSVVSAIGFVGGQSGGMWGGNRTKMEAAGFGK